MNVLEDGHTHILHAHTTKTISRNQSHADQRPVHDWLILITDHIYIYMHITASIIITHNNDIHSYTIYHH